VVGEEEEEVGDDDVVVFSTSVSPVIEEGGPVGVRVLREEGEEVGEDVFVVSLFTGCCVTTTEDVGRTEGELVRRVCSGGGPVGG
jgi:hypothetical protein